MTEILLPCPFCGGEATIGDGGYSGEKFLVRCRDLSCPAASGFIRKTHDEAIAAWNRRAEQNNTPLTLDEIISRCTPKGAELLKNGLLGAVKVCEVEEITPKTNADRIRSMNDEELAKELMRNPAIPCRMCDFYNHKLGYCDAEQEFVCTAGYAEALTLDWLRQPAEDKP